jgi:PPE-repeat protein
MRKLFVMAALLLSVVGAMAQDDKPSVLVEKFTNKSTANSSVCNAVQQAIVSGLVGTGRLTVVDAGTMADLPTVKNDRLLFLNDNGIQWMVEGILNSVSSAHKSSTISGKTTYYYEGDVNYTLTLINTETGVTAISETYIESSTGDSSDEAIRRAANDAKGRMNRFVQENFKVEATIKALDEVDNKKGAKSCYISIGSDKGIEAGQIFEVFSQIEIAGEKVDKKIGEVKVQEVMSGTLSRCSVKNGGPAIKSAFENQQKITVRSRPKKESVLGGLGGLLKF